MARAAARTRIARGLRDPGATPDPVNSHYLAAIPARCARAAGAGGTGDAWFHVMLHRGGTGETWIQVMPYPGGTGETWLHVMPYPGETGETWLHVMPQPGRTGGNMASRGAPARRYWGNLASRDAPARRYWGNMAGRDAPARQYSRETMLYNCRDPKGISRRKKMFPDRIKLRRSKFIRHLCVIIVYIFVVFIVTVCPGGLTPRVERVEVERCWCIATSLSMSSSGSEVGRLDMERWSSVEEERAASGDSPGRPPGVPGDRSSAAGQVSHPVRNTRQVISASP